VPNTVGASALTEVIKGFYEDWISWKMVPEISKQTMFLEWKVIINKLNKCIHFVSDGWYL
jgi:hypothetical protein